MYVLMSTMNGLFVARTGELDGCALDDHRRKQCTQCSALQKHTKGVSISRSGRERTITCTKRKNFFPFHLYH